MKNNEIAFPKYCEIGDLFISFENYQDFWIVGENYMLKIIMPSDLCEDFLFLNLFRIGDCFYGLLEGKYYYYFLYLYL